MFDVLTFLIAFFEASSLYLFPILKNKTKPVFSAKLIFFQDCITIIFACSAKIHEPLARLSYMLIFLSLLELFCYILSHDFLRLQVSPLFKNGS